MCVASRSRIPGAVFGEGPLGTTIKKEYVLDNIGPFVDLRWEEDIIPQLVDYIRIPNKSPHFDPEWESHGFMEEAVGLIERWCRAQPIRGLSVEVVRLPGRTPLIYMEIEGALDQTVLLYGHLDKQPEMVGWREGLGPWDPHLEDGKLYGRGGADDGYAAFASLTAIQALQAEGIAHGRAVVIIEASEESGSCDLPAYIDALADRIGRPDLVVCLDSGCGNYEQLWMTTSLRGMVSGVLNVEVLGEGVHSGDASGIVPSSFRILRLLLSRLEDEATGALLPSAFFSDIPQARYAQAQRAAQVLGDQIYTKFPFVSGMQPAQTELAELVLNRTWRPALSVTGAEGMPAICDAGNVLRPNTAVKLSLRIPPTLRAADVSARLKDLLEAEPPYGARVRFDAESAADGWHAPDLAPWLDEAVNAASHLRFGRDAVSMGEGGSIPFMGMLGEKFPEAQFLITGVLGPASNAHGPNEFLHIEMGKRLTACVSDVLAAHYRHVSR
jgi:acetylornithine deacetylase/succinyl-diaminopimelate desuccinylase-like protein